MTPAASGDGLNPAGGLSVGSRQLRADLANYLQRAEAGEQIVVSVGGRPVARLGPLDDGSGIRPDSLEALAQLGLVESPRRLWPAGGADADEAVNDADDLPSERLPADVRVDRLLRQIRG